MRVVAEGALGPIRKRKTAQHVRENRKTAVKIAQNRKTAKHNDQNRKFTNLKPQDPNP